MQPKLIDASDAVLVVGIGRYQASALEETYRRHGGPTLRLAGRILNSDQFAEEVVQEVFVHLWRNPQSFDPQRGSLRSFLLMKTHGRSVDALRSEAARRDREQAEHSGTTASGHDVEREVLDLTVADRLQGALQALTEDERRAISLAYFGGHTYREVATILRQPEGTVKSRIRTGLKTLRRFVGDLEEHVLDRPGPDRPGPTSSHDRPMPKQGDVR